MSETDLARPFKKILIGLDLSDQTDLVIRTSAYLARVLKAEAQVVTVVNVPTSNAGNDMDGTPANQEEIRLREELLSRLHHYFEDLEPNGIDVRVLHGDPGERISEYADYSDSDLIVVGSRNQGTLKRAFLGSVSESIVGKSKRSVLIIK